MAKNRFATGRCSPVTDLLGIGPKKAEALHGIGIDTVYDAALHYPRAYENRGDVRTVSSIVSEAVCSLVLTVANRPSTVTIRRGMVLTKFRAFDETGSCQITYFNQPYIKDSVSQGETYRFFGRVKRVGTAVSMASPVCEPAGDGVSLRPFSPLYSLTNGITQKQMGAAVSGALTVLLSPATKDGIRESLPLTIRQKYGLCDIGYALRGIHFPESPEMLETAKKRIAFEEIYDFGILLRMAGTKEKTKTDKVFTPPPSGRLLAGVPYEPTGAQKRTFAEIDRDLASGFLMNRLLTGDVGSGKTLCAAYALWSALENGYQAALMAPTEILAAQHYDQLAPLLESLGYRVALLTGSTTKAKKNKIYDYLAVGTVDLVIGTHALIEEAVTFRRLGLAVIDEQHRFGARQREALALKGNGVHILSMSATPIPRTLALVLYGDSDLSTLDEMPPNRQKTDTYCVDETYRPRLNAFIRKNVEEGGQVYIVCPAVEEQDQIEGENGDPLSLNELLTADSFRAEKPRLKSAVAFAKELSEMVFPDYSLKLIHGKMKGSEKDRIMADFAAGKIQILVSTTVIEVGVNVPNASLMIVENAENFGLAQLHQLRGRVGRGSRKSYCILVSDSHAEEAKKRLSLMRETNDGYRIAEADLEMRGPGDFIEQRTGKVRQSGDFSLMNQAAGDSKLLYSALEEAAATLECDPGLNEEKNRETRKRVVYLREKNQFI
ncbi:MAG: ATP-dependent DNA helicase RecG [Ruminococcus sp.]|nr:ATP-dependent DNA helicase RecG [Candidatus Apopatosoma intestinale]